MKFSTYIRAVAICLLTAVAPAMAAAADEYPQLTNVPTLYIDTEGGASVKSKETYVKCTVRYVDADSITIYDAANIRGRGNSTWGFAKKPYRLKFDKKQRFLGPDRAKAKSWTLLANHADKSLIRNAVASFVGTFAGQPFTAAAQPVDLVLNGEYLGSYQISDQIDVRKKRVDIVEQPDTIYDDTDISGGYLLEADGLYYQEPVYFVTDNGVGIAIKSPDDEVIQSSQKEYIQDVVQRFETALYSDDFADALKGYRQYVDSLTLASWYVASELTANPDCFWSTYMYKDQGDDKIYFGPLWDFDIAMNNCTRTGDVSERLMIDAGFGAGVLKPWAQRLWQDPWFVQLINRQWQSMAEQGVEQKVVEYIDSLAAVIDRSQALNFQKWSIKQRVWNELVLFSTYTEGITYLKDFFHTHCAYLTDALAEAAGQITEPSTNPDSGKTDETTEFVPNSDYLYYITNANTGLCADLSDDATAVVLNKASYAASQQWYFEPIDLDGYYRIVNYATGQAMSDAAPYYRNAYTTGTQVRLYDASTDSLRQDWQFVAVSGTTDRYVVENLQTNLAWNNDGGYRTDGTRLISWTNDSNNPNKPNRQWIFSLAGVRQHSAMADLLNGPQYMLTYSLQTATLHFRASDESILADGQVQIFTAAGQLAATRAAAADIDVSDLRAGLYVVTWKMGRASGSAKFTKQ